MAKSTPMLRQYRQLKARFPDAILLFRLGDFYEMFEDQARLVSRQLGLVLTSRRFSKSVKLPMCGVPYRQLTTYVYTHLVSDHYHFFLVVYFLLYQIYNSWNLLL